jgi:hypothetical protein
LKSSRFRETPSAALRGDSPHQAESGKFKAQTGLSVDNSLTFFRRFALIGVSGVLPLKCILFSFALFCLGCGQVLAATLDFSMFRSGRTTAALTFPTAAISASEGGALFVYGTGGIGLPAGPVCALQSSFSCTGDVSILFIGPVSDLRFRGYYATETDRATITAWSNDTPLAFVVASGNSGSQFDVDFTGLSGITRVDIADRSDAISQGIAYGDFTFTPGVARPPPPAKKVIGFDSLASGVGPSSAKLGKITITAWGTDRLFVYRSGDFGMPTNGGFCAYDLSGRCMGDATLDFGGPIDDLTFAGFWAKLTDGVFVSLFNGAELVYAGLFMGTTSGTIRFDFSQYGTLTRLTLQDRSNVLTKGMAFGDFRYREVTIAPPPDPEPPPAPVPLPAPLLLLGTLLGGLAVAAHGRRAVRNGPAVAA